MKIKKTQEKIFKSFEEFKEFYYPTKQPDKDQILPKQAVEETIKEPPTTQKKKRRHKKKQTKKNE